MSNGYSRLESNPNVSSYVTEGYIDRWERLDYTKQETKQSTYNFTAWSYQSEYSVHMYGWFATGWAEDRNIPVFSEWADRFKDAEMVVGSPDERWYVEAATYVWGFLGL